MRNHQRTTQAIQKISVATLIFVVLNGHYAQSQSASGEDPLAGLTLVTDENEADETPDLMTLDTYTEDGKKLIGPEKMQHITAGGEMLFYMDDDKVVKAMVVKEPSIKEGDAALPFTVQDLDGKEYSLESLRGKVVVLNFWFVECRPCIMEMPRLNELVEKYQDRDDVVFLAIARNPKEKVEKLLKKHAFNYQIIPDRKDLIEEYGVETFPRHIIIDQEANIAFSTLGALIDRIDQKIEALIQ